MVGWQIFRRGVVAGTIAAATAAGARCESPRPKEAVLSPATRITLTSIGASTPPARMVTLGASVLTVNLVDDTHLLVTFEKHELVPREKGDPSTDTDRILMAEIVKLPAGTVVQKTTWHAHDEARYLWPIGHGRFVVRLGNVLSVMDAGQDPEGPHALDRVSLPHAPGTPLGVIGEPEGRAFSIITEEPAPPQAEGKVVFGDNTDNAPKPTYAVQFFRVETDPNAAAAYVLAGQLRADIPLIMPMDADGYLWALNDARGQGHWAISFNDFDGKSTPAGTVDSSCVPKMHLVSRSEYVAFTCRGTDDFLKLRSMGLDGHETWEEDFGTFSEAPAFAYAADASRFAISRMWTSLAPGDPAQQMQPSQQATPPEAPTESQEVRVYQNASGDLLAKVALTPVFRVPENFDLSADGRVLAVVHDDELDVYALPALTKTDREDVAEVQKFEPAESTAAVRFPQLYDVGATKAAESADVAARQALSAPVSTTTAASVASTGGPVEAANAGDVTPSGARRRPTLLNPGEKPEFKDKTAPVQ